MPGRDLDHADRLAVQLESQRVREHRLGGLRGVVAGSRPGTAVCAAVEVTNSVSACPSDAAACRSCGSSAATSRWADSTLTSNIHCQSAGSAVLDAIRAARTAGDL